MIVATVKGKKSNVILNKTLHVPKLRMNLLSVSKITDKGYRVVFDKQKATVTDQKGHTKLIARRIGDLYLIDGEPPNTCQNAEVEAKESKPSAVSKSNAKLWHQRMGHLYFRDLVRASKDGTIHQHARLH